MRVIDNALTELPDLICESHKPENSGGCRTEYG
jgi:hypothetical protein